ncbi:methyltransferase [Streptomyces cinnamoneus]|uniref:Methyltransferase n=1 Tax=Streptomyces cinnamoneus TaxID=53446 RepID=A0A2G1XA10_STRCJ|nr:methyltransferase [Streptomyces cinnamoneus]PHQ48053.1 methyltransferase [Streptomyces cinnamoneus]PPT15679.1 methyltransferase [Streptomyces cinnamoneus]
MDLKAEPAGDGWRSRVVIMQLVWGHMTSSILSTTTRLGIMDHLGDGERTADEVASLSGTQTEATLRLLRAQAALGLLEEPRPGVFRLTSAGALLRSGRDDSLASLVRLLSDPLMTKPWDHLDACLRTGLPAFDDVYGDDFFTYLKKHPDISAVFNAAMSEGTRTAAEAVAGLYDFNRFRTIVDVGGGDGTLLSYVLRAHPAPRGILYDTAEGLAQAPARLAAEGLTDRCALETGDFFTGAPAGGDLYLLKSIIHDWNDAQCAQILRGVRAVVPADGRVLIVEPVLPERVDPAGAQTSHYLSDLNMLVNVGGRERTRQDFEELCAGAGFAVDSVTSMPAPNPFSLIEVAPV